MQYLLTQEEMDARITDQILLQKITGRSSASLSDYAEGLKNVCQHVATTMIQTVPVNGGGVSDRPHGCIHVKHVDPRWQTPYCDGCQVAGICPQPKEWSK